MKKKGFVEKTLYGKDKDDFTNASLPSNRYSAFFKVIKTNWMHLIILSMLSVLAFLPLYFCYVAKSAYILEKSLEVSSDLLPNLVISTNLVFGVIMIPLLILGMTILQGVIGIIRKMVFREGYLLFIDFIKSIKSGIKNTIINALILGLILNISSFNFNFLSLETSIKDYLKAIILIVVLIILIFTLLISLTNVCLNSIYELNIKSMYKNSFLLVFAKPLKSLLFLFIVLLPILLLIFAPSFLMGIIILIIMFLFINAISLLIYFLYNSSLFDEYINKKYCPNIYRKGLKK